MTKKQEFLNSCVIIDTETTGIDYKTAEVVEYGFCIYKDKKWEEHNWLNNCYSELAYEVMAITNISPDMIKDEPYFQDRIESLDQQLSPYVESGIKVAHNAKFDSGVLEKYDMAQFNTPWLCTLRMAKKLYQNDPTVTQYSLAYLRYRMELDVPEDIEAHRASADAHMTGLLLEKFIDTLEEQGVLDESLDYGDQIEAWLEQPIIMEVMPFGKHKGKKLKDVPLSYWEWALGSLDSLDETKDNYDKDFALSVAKTIEEQLT